MSMGNNVQSKFRHTRLAGLLASSSVAALLIGGGAPAFAACTNVTGAYTNPSGATVACIIVQNTSFTGNLSNAGTIKPGNGALNGTGIAINNSTITGQISNAGVISVGGQAITIDSTSGITGGISNAGAISAGESGIVIAGSTFTGGISNSGTISAGGTGVKVFQVSTFTGGISNSGTISAAGPHYGINVSGATTNHTHDALTLFTGGITNSGVISGGDFTAVTVNYVGTFTGGISNSGTISAVNGADGIFVGSVSTFTGGISNSGKISAATGNTGIAVFGVSTFTGGITNAGTISASNGGIGISTIAQFGSSSAGGGITNTGTISVGGDGISVNNVSTFYGGISNSGTILAGFTAIVVSGVSTFSGGISNSGTISGAVGIVVASSGLVSIFDSGTLVGTGGTAVDLSGNAAGNTFTLGPGYSITGLVKGQGSDTFQLGGTGSGSFNLSNIGTQYTGFGTFNVESGVWTVSGATTTAWTVAGGTFGGAATIGSVTVGAGGTFAPGAAGAAMRVNGSLTLQSAAVYLVTFHGASTSSASVSGAASIASGARFAVASGSTPVANSTYTVLAATGGVTGTFANQDIFFGAYEGVLSYAGNDVDLTVKFASLLPLLPANAPANVVNVANTIGTAIQGGVTPPAGFANLFNLPPAQLQSGLSQLSGEAATSAGKGANQLMTDFMELMLDPTAGGGGNISGGGATGFAPEQDTSLPSDVARAYADALKGPQAETQPQSFDQRWTAWGSAFGGASHIDGNAAAGTNNVTASDYGFAAGMERRLTPDTVYGFGLAGGGTNWNVAQALGSGRSDSFQAGLYAKTHWGPLYLSGGLAFANHWFTTDRIAMSDQLRATFTGQSYAARGEVGYRYAVPVTGVIVGVTPYAALQAQDFHTPSYSETDLTGGGFALGYNAQNATDTRSELGARFDNLQVVQINGMGMPLVLRGRLAWAHDWVTGSSLGAAFQALPGSSFTVNGAAPPQNSALTTAAAELHLNANWTAIAKFDGEFASGAQTYGGTGTLKYSW